MTGVLGMGTVGRSWDGMLVMEWVAVGGQWDGGPRQWLGLGAQSRTNGGQQIVTIGCLTWAEGYATVVADVEGVRR